MLKKSEVKNCILFLGMLLLMAVAVIFVFIMKGNQSETFTDVIYGFVSHFDGNKSIEMSLVYLVSFGGVLLIAVTYFAQLFLKGKNGNFAETSISKRNEDSRRISEYLCVLGTTFFTILILQGSVVGYIVPIFLLGGIFLFVDRKSIVPAISAYFTVIYSLYGLFRTIALFVYWPEVSAVFFIMIATAVAAFPIVLKDRYTVYCRLILVTGLFVPLLFSTFLTNKYIQNGEVITLNASARIWIAVALFAGLCIYSSVRKMKREWNRVSFERSFSVGTCIAIASANSMYGTGLVMWGGDLHHPFEDIFGYFQVVDAGQIPFKNYIPVSGMYSFVQGFFYDVVGGDKFANYYVTTGLYYSCVIALVIYLLSRQISSDRMFLLSLLYYMIWYNRMIFVLPIMLVLVDEKIVKDRAKWLFLWFVTSLFNGLYYPLYGAAVCVGFIPLGIYQMIVIIRNKEYKDIFHSVRGKIYITVCTVLLVLNFYFLYGTLKHMLNMSGQSLFADGVARFGCQFHGPAYLPDSLNGIVWYEISFLFPCVLVWISLIVAIMVARIERREGKVFVGEWAGFLSAISSIFVLTVSFSYTFIRMDLDGAYNRTQGVISAAGIVLLVLIFRFINGSNVRYYLICAITVIMVAGGYAGVRYMDKGTSYYTVPEDYIYVSKDCEIDKLGEGFFKESNYNELLRTGAFFNQFDMEKQGFCGGLDFGDFYFARAKGDSVANLTTMKGYDASTELARTVVSNSTVMTPMDSFIYYYIYNWMMASGEMVYDSEKQAFLVNDGSFSLDTVKNLNRKYKPSNDISMTNSPGAWGNSFESLLPVFDYEIDDVSISNEGDETRLCFNEIADGADADFLYIEFTGMNQQFEYNIHSYTERWMVEGRLTDLLVNKDYNPGLFVKISWNGENGEECSVNCEMNNGKLLVPLGSGQDWLLYPHDSLNISLFTELGECDYVPEVTDVKLLKLRSVSGVK